MRAWLTPVWRTARGAARRRRLQTFIIGTVVLLSTATTVFALGLLATSTHPFDRAYAHQRGAHLVAAFDPALPTDRIAATAHRAGVSAAAGPFAVAGVSTVPGSSGSDGDQSDGRLGRGGRADPGGPVDRVLITRGRWVRAPGEVVLAD